MSNIWFYEPFYDFDRLFDEAFSNRQAAQGAGSQVARLSGPGGSDTSKVSRVLKPRMDLHEDREKNLVTAHFEFPGVSKDEVQIEVHQNRLTVSAEVKQASDIDENGYAVRERRYGKFSRTLQLPEGVKENEIKAGMENGVLTISFPKSTPELAPKRIAIN
ncbi:hypothetical protein M413DRAFT_445308 [Hebeloma cylindrosporum]|uniref:Uncharacterized protein n=1 Tax=Hebeloma cylindrosporum TaxID=76867 RepID=A0A0C2YJR4_HEBCY|nr:hypothetical protein M413DRAFT_445308 [Hebeloma cylindrosporum h7]